MFTCNEYFAGQEMSPAFPTADKPATVGVLAPGDYSCATAAAESSTLIGSEAVVTLPDASESRRFAAGASFAVSGDSACTLHVPVATAYLGGCG